jgi:hypothetical protein
MPKMGRRDARELSYKLSFITHIRYRRLSCPEALPGGSRGIRDAELMKY